MTAVYNYNSELFSSKPDSPQRELTKLWASEGLANEGQSGLGTLQTVPKKKKVTSGISEDCFQGPGSGQLLRFLKKVSKVLQQIVKGILRWVPHSWGSPVRFKTCPSSAGRVFWRFGFVGLNSCLQFSQPSDNWAGIQGGALEWFRFYLEKRFCRSRVEIALLLCSLYWLLLWKHLIPLLCRWWSNLCASKTGKCRLHQWTTAVH